MHGLKARQAPPLVALATFFVVVQFYTSLASLSPTPPVGYVFATRPVAAALVAALALSAAWSGWWLMREGALFGRSTSHAILAAWLGSAALSSALGLDPGSGFAVVATMLLGALFHLALVRAFGRPGVAQAVLVPYLLAGLLAAIAGVAMALLRSPALLSATNHGRAAGVFVTANQFAAFLIAFAFVALGYALARDGASRRLGAVAAAAAFIALLATLSVAALLGAVLAGIFYAFALGARRVALGLAVLAFLGALAAALHPIAGHNPAERFDRLRTWEAGWRVATLFPLTGVGPMAYWRVYPAVRPLNAAPLGTFGALHPHDAYLSLAGELGLVGIAAFAFGTARFTRSVRAGLRVRTPRERRFVLGVCAALIAVLVQGLFDTVGIVQMSFVWIPYTALALGAAESGWPQARAGLAA